MSDEHPEVATMGSDWNPEDDTGELEPGVPTCRVCGCTDEQACEGGCSWVPDPQQLGDLCSSCLPLVRAVQAAVAGEVRRRPIVTVNVNIVADITKMPERDVARLIEGLAKLQGAYADGR